MGNIEGIKILNLKKIPTIGGEVMHAIKRTDAGFSEFGEAYFTSIDSGLIRGWKLHRSMILNLVVPVGNIKFVFHDFRTNSKTYKMFQEINIGINNYCRLTIPSNIWFAFQGLDEKNLILNLSNILHDPNEVITKSIDKLGFHQKDLH